MQAVAGQLAGCVRGGLDCNGFSPLQKTFRHLMCTEIASNSEYGFLDNGHYVGHDEPDLGFFSNTPGSGNSMSYQMVLPKDPAGPELWGSVEEGLASSRRFILLASADAAGSVWVDREVRWWREHRSPGSAINRGDQPRHDMGERERGSVRCHSRSTGSPRTGRSIRASIRSTG